MSWRKKIDRHSFLVMQQLHDISLQQTNTGVLFHSFPWSDGETAAIFCFECNLCVRVKISRWDWRRMDTEKKAMSALPFTLHGWSQMKGSYVLHNTDMHALRMTAETVLESSVS